MTPAKPSSHETSLLVKLKWKSMEGDVKQIPTSELETRMKDLETSYAECLSSNEDSHILHRIWKRIQELQTELRNRQSAVGT